MKTLVPLPLLCSLFFFACTDDEAAGETDGNADTGDGDGDTGGASGDGDGDTGGASGDGDTGGASGDGDTGGASGDGDGDGDTGDGDGDGDTGGASGDGDGGMGGDTGDGDGSSDGEQQVTLPDGVVLQVPVATLTDAPFDCSREDVLCVPEEFSTLQNAADAASAGKTVVVSPGSYAAFSVWNTGSQGSPITFIARPGVVIDDFSDSEHGITFQSAFDEGFYVDYVRVAGFTIDGPPGRCLYLTKAVSNRPTVGHYIGSNTCLNAGREGFVLSQMSLSLVENNVIINAGNGSSIDDLDHGIYLSNGGTGRSIIRNNFIAGSSTNGIHMNGDTKVNTREDGTRGDDGTDGLISGCIFDGNIIVGNGQNGFNMDGVQESLFINNVFYRNSRHAIRAYAIDGAAGPQNMVVINNTFIENDSGIKFTDSLGAHIAFNNLFVDMRDDPIVVPTGELTEASNLVADGLEFGALPVEVDAIDPGAVSGFDFRPADGSELEDAGTDALGGQDAPQHDLLGTSRSAPIDIGAFEY